MMQEPFGPTHAVPAEGLPYWVQPDANRPPDGRVEGGLPVQVVSEGGGWARGRFSNLWETWVDGRLLLHAQGQPGFFAATHQIPRAGLDARARPDASDPVVTRVQGGLPVQVLTENNGWAEVRFENQWEIWIDGRQLAPLGSARSGGSTNPIALWLPMAGGAVVLGASFLPWFSAGVESISSWDLPIASLFDKTSTSTAPDSGWLLLVVLASAIPLLTRSPLPRAAIGALGAVPVVVALLALRLYLDFPSPRPDLGVGLILTLVGGLVIAAAAFLPDPR